MMMMRRNYKCVLTRCTSATQTSTRHFSALHTPFNQKLSELPLEWKQSLVPNGIQNELIYDTVVYKHPTYEQLLQVKQARYARTLLIQKRTQDILKEKEQVLKTVNDPFERKQVEDQYIEKLEEMKRTVVAEKTLTAEEIKQCRDSYAQDPYTNSTQSLGRRFGVKPFYVLQVVDNLILESPAVVEKKKKELKELKVYNQNKPKKSTRRIHQIK
jgi:hypothetical protein